ncbi:MAG: hypothetical protein B7X34_06035 [Acidobacteriia bacterium 12-62-4]|nr:MAG: hypothetical protein B7X34_06035 [Acidobacteriia bacterium 12-62-4]
MASRQVRYTACASAYILVFVAILAGVNFLANRYNKSFDTTATKRYSLSDQTVKLITGLKGDITFTVVDQTARFTAWKDLLEQYRNLSSKVKIEYVDPVKNPQVAMALGARPPFGQVFVENGTRTQEAAAMTEQELTATVIKLLKTGDRTVCVYSGAGEPSLEDRASSGGFAFAKASLERNNYKTQVVKSLQTTEVPAECTAILVAGPRSEYPDPVIGGIKAFVEKGGHALFLLGPALRTEREDAIPHEKLAALLDSWGITVNNDVAIDESGSGAAYGFGKYNFVVDQFEQHPMVRELGNSGVLFPLVRSLTTKERAEKVLSTPEKSFATKDLDLKKSGEEPAAGTKGPLTLAAATTVGKARVVVFGSVRWATNGALQYQANRDLFLNAFSWMSSDEDLLSIRPKEPDDRRLDVRPGQGWIFPFASFFPPLLVIIGGVMVWLRRR